jgi:photosystem II stability/assembly factor-like uncharacterized protein
MSRQPAASKEATNNSLARAEGALMPRWTLTSDGTLLRSFDEGKTWKTIQVSDNAAFRALSAVGQDIWVGGIGGALFHSSNAGQDWQQISPVAGEKTLQADIIGVEFTDRQHGKLSTADSETWITADGGESWHQQ